MSQNCLVKTLGLVSVLLAAGCSTSYETVDLDPSTKGYWVFCGGMPYASFEDCEDRATDICGEIGYQILSEGVPPYVHAQSMWDLTTRKILVRCNKTSPAPSGMSTPQIAPVPDADSE